MSTLPNEDLSAIVQGLGSKWQDLNGADVLITGGTGFFGVWLVSTLLHADEQLGLNLRVHVLARKPDQILARAPELRDAPGLRLVSADVRRFKPAPGQRITHIIHAATPSSVALNDFDPSEMANVAAEGTHHLLRLGRELGIERMLVTSSGAVYGRFPAGITHIREDQMGSIDPLSTRNAYTEGKRLAELYCASHHERFGLPVTIARCFAFVGPYLPLDIHFAIGNFMRDALRGKPIVVLSDGKSRRSYLYATDLVQWLVLLLTRGASGRAYNVGSEYDISVGELADLVGAQRGVSVEIRGNLEPNRPTDCYVPSTQRIRSELGAAQLVDLESSVRRTMEWYERDANR